MPVQDPDDPEALPVTFPVKAPTKDVAVNAPVLELNVRVVAVLGARFQLAAVANKREQEVSVDSAATVIEVGTPVAAHLNPLLAVESAVNT